MIVKATIKGNGTNTRRALAITGIDAGIWTVKRGERFVITDVDSARKLRDFASNADNGITVTVTPR